MILHDLNFPDGAAEVWKNETSFPDPRRRLSRLFWGAGASCQAGCTVICGTSESRQPLTCMEIMSGNNVPQQLIRVCGFTIDALLNGRNYDLDLKSVSGYLFPHWEQSTSNQVIRVETSIGTDSDPRLRVRITGVPTVEEVWSLLEEDLKYGGHFAEAVASSIQCPMQPFLLPLTPEQVTLTGRTLMSELGLDAGVEYEFVQPPSSTSVVIEAFPCDQHRARKL